MNWRKCQKGYRQIEGQRRTCQEINFNTIAEQLKTGYLDKYESVQVEVHKVSQFDGLSAVSTPYLGKVNVARENAFKAQEQFSLTDQ